MVRFNVSLKYVIIDKMIDFARNLSNLRVDIENFIISKRYLFVKIIILEVSIINKLNHHN